MPSRTQPAGTAEPGRQGLERLVTWRPSRNAQQRQSAIAALVERAIEGDLDARAEIALADGRWQPAHLVPAIADALADATPRRRPRAIAEAEFDMTPMIDCTFLLLLFFMLTAHYERQKTIDTPPPPGQGAAVKTLSEHATENIIATIGKDGSLRVGEKSVRWEDARKYLAERREAEGKSSLIIVMEDDGKWELTVRLQDEATQAGIEKIRYGKPVAASGPK